MSDKILIPLLCYNYGRFLPECLESIIRQTHKNWKVVVRDPGSTDNTKQAMSYYTRIDSRITYIQEKGPLSVGAARNKTIKENPNFPIIVYHDVDDIMIQDRLELSIKALSDSHIVYGNARCFGLSQNISTSFPYVNYKLIIQRNIINGGTTCFRYEVWRGIGGFDENMYSGSDYDFYIRVAKAGFKFKYLNKILMMYRIHSESITQGRSLKNKLLSYIHFEMQGIKINPDVNYALNKHKTRNNIFLSIIMYLLSKSWEKVNSINASSEIHACV